MLDGDGIGGGHRSDHFQPRGTFDAKAVYAISTRAIAHMLLTEWVEIVPYQRRYREGLSDILVKPRSPPSDSNCGISRRL
jgi:hypothetical protein